MNKQISMKNILFGDVYICSGQSNMVRPVNYVINASTEVQDANNYPFIRIMTAATKTSNTPLNSLLEIELAWNISMNVTIGGGPDLNRNYFSAVCWFYGRDLYQTLNYPLGLIETAFGGTSINSWSSPQVLKTCNVSVTDYQNALSIAHGVRELEIYDNAQANDSQLWYVSCFCIQ